ncbi:MAG TPA: hypothetical protein VES73_18815 [Lamprocystis sp. (in: g-proteobacteria)]|nr:hypothetical protein [Lamprocystis sp. (in: g-proteobacteria)]
MSFAADLPRVQLRVPPDVRLDDELLFAICQAKTDDQVLPGFCLNLAGLWAPGF